MKDLKRLIEALQEAGYKIIQFKPSDTYSSGAIDLTIAPEEPAK